MPRHFLLLLLTRVRGWKILVNCGEPGRRSVSVRGGVGFREGEKETTEMARKKSKKRGINHYMPIDRLGSEHAEYRQARREREAKLEAAKEKQIRENRKNDWTVIWQGGAPQ